MSQTFCIRVKDHKGFARAFRLAAKVARKKAINPICESVLLDIANDPTLQATDLAQHLTINLRPLCSDFTLEGYGKLFLPADWKTPSEPFSLTGAFSEQGLTVTLKLGVLETTVPQKHEAAEYPLFPSALAGAKMTLDAAQFAQQLKLLAPLCATEKGRYALNGMLFDFEGKKAKKAGPSTPLEPPFTARLVGTDGRRLGAHALTATVERAPRFQSILHFTHAVVLADLLNAVSDTDPNIEAHFAPEEEKSDAKGKVTEVEPVVPRMQFCNSCFSYHVLLVEGQFPNWRTVLPKCDATVLVPRMELLDALEAIKKATSVESAAVRLTFNADHLLLEAKSEKNGYAKTTIALTEVPPQMVLGFDPAYLQDSLNALTGDWVVLRFRSPEHGIELHDGAPDLRYQLVMPIDVVSEPVEPKHPGIYMEQDEKWDSKQGVWVKTTAEEKAAAKAAHQKQLDEYNAQLRVYQSELTRWQCHKRISADTMNEQKHGEFTPRPEGEPAIGTQLAPHPTMAELDRMARDAAPVKARKKQAAKPVTPAVAPVPAAAWTPEANSDVETADQLGYKVDKSQTLFW